MNRRANRTIGLTLIEMMVVVGIVALMVGFGTPAMRALVNSFQSEGGAVSMVNAALGSARAMAVSRQRYVGVRFQKLCTSPDAANPLKGLMDAPQYMIFIVHEEAKNNGGLASGFRAMEGLEPIKLPGTTGIMELTWIANDAGIDEPAELSDATTFSIVFSPAGKLIVHDVRVRNQNGVFRPDNRVGKTSRDDVFNSPENICNLRQGMFLQDDYSKRKNPAQSDALEYGLGEEPSRTSLVIYEPSKLRMAYEKKTAWTDYLSTSAVKTFYVSPYTGDLISSD
jgi:type II secretory pathway pseudopilin PulG